MLKMKCSEIRGEERGVAFWSGEDRKKKGDREVGSGSGAT